MSDSRRSTISCVTFDTPASSRAAASGAVASSAPAPLPRRPLAPPAPPPPPPPGGGGQPRAGHKQPPLPREDVGVDLGLAPAGGRGKPRARSSLAPGAVGPRPARVLGPPPAVPE